MAAVVVAFLVGLHIVGCRQHEFGRLFRTSKMEGAKEEEEEEEGCTSSMNALLLDKLLTSSNKKMNGHSDSLTANDSYEDDNGVDEVEFDDEVGIAGSSTLA